MKDSIEDFEEGIKRMNLRLDDINQRLADEREVLKLMIDAQPMLNITKEQTEELKRLYERI